jgi:glutathione S-transferase
MLTLWGRPTSDNCTKLLWTLGEIGLSYTLVETNIGPPSAQPPELLELNPNGLVPVLREEDFLLWESNCIVRYLCAKFSADTLYPGGLQERAIAEQWMDWQTTTLERPLSQMLWSVYRSSPGQADQRAVEAARQSAAKAMGILNGHLATRDFVAGCRLTMGDIPVGVMAYRWFGLESERPSVPHLERWYRRLCDLPEYRRNVMRPLA